MLQDHAGNAPTLRIESALGEGDEKASVPTAPLEPLTTQRFQLPPGVRGIFLPLGLLIVWQLISSVGLVPSTLLPSPLATVHAFIHLGSTGELENDVKISLARAAAGFALGGGLGLLTGVAVGLFRWFEQILDPSVQAIRTLPHLAITPLFILWFGLGETSKVLLIALGAFFPLYINTFMGIRGVDRKLFEVARILEFGKVKQLTKLILPAALPNILLGLRLSIGVSWLGLIVAELMGSSAGVGYLIENATQFSQTADVFVGLVLFAAVGKLSDALVRFCERRMLKWRDTFEG